MAPFFECYPWRGLLGWNPPSQSKQCVWGMPGLPQPTNKDGFGQSKDCRYWCGLTVPNETNAGASYPTKPTTAERFCRRRGKLSPSRVSFLWITASTGNFIHVCWLCWPKIKHLGKACHLCHCARRLDCGLTAQGENKGCPIFVAFRFHCVFLPSSPPTALFF